MINKHNAFKALGRNNVILLVEDSTLKCTSDLYRNIGILFLLMLDIQVYFSKMHSLDLNK